RRRRGGSGPGGEPGEGCRALRRGGAGRKAAARSRCGHPDRLSERRGRRSRRSRQPGGSRAERDPGAGGPRPRGWPAHACLAEGQPGDEAMSPKKIVVPLVLLAAAGAGAWYAFGRPKQEDETTLSASGTVEATEAQLGFQATGRIEEVAVKEGDRVHAGQVLARLDPAEAEARRA